jgi:CRISPR-associated protein Csb1
LLSRRDDLGVPEIVLDLSELGALPPHLPKRLSSFQFPHRQADAYLRDANIDGTEFGRSEIGQRLFGATRQHALALLEWFPQALLYGFWQSHLGKKMSQAKLARSWVSEIVGIEPANTEGRVLGVKGDPLNLSTDEKVQFDPNDLRDWASTESKKEGGKGERLSEIGHGQVPFKRGEEALAGVSFARIEQRATLSFAGLRQVTVGNSHENAAARAAVAALSLVAHVAAFGKAFTLRSGCDLRPTKTTWMWLGNTADEALEPPAFDSALVLFKECVASAEALGLPVGTRWPAPLKLVPSKQLADVIRKTYPVTE